MIQSIWEAFLARLGRNGEPEAEQADSRFVPSRLDLSIREAHGGNDVGVGLELANIKDHAERIEGEYDE